MAAKDKDTDKAKTDEPKTAASTTKNEPDQSKAGETTVVDGHPQALDGVPPGTPGSGAPAPEKGVGPGADTTAAGTGGGGMDGPISDPQANDPAEVTADPTTDGPLPGTGGEAGGGVKGLYVPEGPKDPGTSKADPAEFHYPGGEGQYNSDRAMARKLGVNADKPADE